MMNISVKLPQNTSYEFTGKVVKDEIEDYLLENRERFGIDLVYSNGGDTGSILNTVLSGSGENNASVQIVLVKRNKRKMSIDELTQILKDHFKVLQEKYGATVSIDSEGLQLSSILGNDVEVMIYNDDINKLKSTSQEIKQRLLKVDGIDNITTSYDDSEEMYELNINRNMSLLQGLVPLQVVAALQPYTTGVDGGNMFINDKSYPIKIFYDRSASGTDWIGKVPVSSLTGRNSYTQIVSSLDKTLSPRTINRRNFQRVCYINITLNKKLKLGKAVRLINDIVINDNSYSGFKPEIGGQGEILVETLHQFGFALLIGMIIMYLIIGAQFESLVYPLIIFITIPMALVGVFFVSIVGNLTLNVSSLVGMLTLAGIIVNNGIVLITQINQLKAAGYNTRDAVVEGSVRRLRPILMTSLTTFVALIPTALSRAEGYEIESPLALTILSGVFIGTVFTIFLVPILYEFIDNIKKRKKQGPKNKVA
jgi:HAE1 family hydrophobic/amphiphilic exporter-1